MNTTPIADSTLEPGTADDSGPFINLRDTGRFLQVLERLGCSLAISRRPSGVAILGVDNGIPTLAACLLPRSMGLATDGARRLAVATVRELMVFHNVQSIAHIYPKRPGHYDAVYVPRTQHFTGYLDLHDMAFDNQVILAINTRYSCLCVLDSHFNFTPIWQPPFISEFTPEDRCHLNGMAFTDRRVQFVTALGQTDTPSGWRQNMATDGILMEVPSGRIVAQGLSMPHSPRVFGNRLYVLEGGKGHVLRVDPVIGDRQVVAALPGFTHGLAEYGGILFVGLSKLRDKRGPQGLPIESERERLVAGVAALDAGTGDVLGILEFYNGVDEVFDVQVLPDVRRAEIVDPQRWFEQPSIVTIKGGFWQKELVAEDTDEALGIKTPKL